MNHDSLQNLRSSKGSLPNPPQQIEPDTIQAIQQLDTQDLADSNPELVNNDITTANPPGKSKRRIWLYLLLGVGIVAVCGVFFRQLQNNPQETPPPAVEPARLSVRATEVKIQPLQKFVFGDGYVSAVRGKHLTFETSGTITYIKKVNGRDLREGDFVKAGELLAKVDDRKLRAELAQAQAQTAEAETQRVTAQAGISQANASIEQAKADVIREQANLEAAQDAYRLAKSELKRYEKLFAEGAISTSEVDVRRNQAKEASAQVKAAQAQITAAQSQVKSSLGQLESAKSQLQSTRATIASARAGQNRSNVNLEDTVIKAPFNGIVAHMNIREGDYWTTQRLQVTGDYQDVVDSVPMILIDPNAYEVRLRLPAFDGTLVRPGQSAYVVLDKDMSAASTAGMSQETLLSLARARGRVFSVSPSVSPGERAVQVTVRLNGGMKNVRDGERVSVWLAVENNPRALTVPPDAIVYRDQKPHVFVVDKEKQIVKLRAVSEGIRGISQQEIRSGVKPGELVVTQGRNRLVDGTPVEVVNGGERGR
ncbi:MAG: efflux RND transporter periplasmic adaptor subunit [Cyanobacteria bacterium P01_D01_bin.50]